MKKMKKNFKLSNSGMRRREFISTSAMGIGGLTLLPSSFLSILKSNPELLPASPINTTKINLKIINGAMVHEDAWEGSCRVGDLENLTYEAEIKNLESGMNRLKDTLAKLNLPKEVQLLEPVTMHAWVEAGNQDIILPDDHLDKLAKDNKITDLYVTVSPFIGYYIAKRYRKPVCILNNAGWAVDGPGGIRSLGVDAYHAHNWDEVFEVTRLMLARKAFANTRLLNITDFPNRVPWGVVSNNTNLDAVKAKYGMGYEHMNYRNFFGYMDEIEQNKEMISYADDIAKKLLENSNSSNMTQENISKSVLFYLAVASMMRKQGCNAFTIECFELCSSLHPWNRKFTPCLTHALLKDSGFPSVCEGDINALLSMMVLMYLSHKAIYMGNPRVDKENNHLNIHHSVASLKMFGIDDKASSPYDIHSFMKAGYGATLRHDFSRNMGEQVTVGRFDPTGTKMLVSSGEVVEGGGLTGCGCANNVTIKIPNGRAFWKAQQNYGHHLTFVYGDYVHQIEDLGELMNFEVENIT
jgi:hypothetical protein